MRKLLVQKKHRPMCEHAAFLPVGSTGVARLDHHRPHTDIPPHRWRQFLSDCNNFLTGDENWAGRAAELGWNAASLFGCRRVS
jgi:hypothetical protein